MIYFSRKAVMVSLFLSQSLHSAECFHPTRMASRSRIHSPARNTLPSGFDHLNQSNRPYFRKRQKFLLHSVVEDEESKISVESPEEKFDKIIEDNDLERASTLLTSNPKVKLTPERLYKIFDAIEYRTGQLDENMVPLKSSASDNSRSLAAPLPMVSKARLEMTKMYETLRDIQVLSVFGAVGPDTFPVEGSKSIAPTTLETITDMSMTALTPKGTQVPLLLAGGLLAIAEGITSVYFGIPFSALVFATLLFAVVDKVAVNGATSQGLLKFFWPEYSQKILKHEAGHFLAAYLLGCPVEGCVLSALAAMNDYRFGGPFTSVSAGTSFFDPALMEQMNNIKPLSRSSIDRFSIIVMAGIAAEALNFGRADGGAGDEMSLVGFLSQINPRSGGAQAWDGERIRNQARWGVVQAVMMLKEYRPCYDALVDALERGGKLGECVYAIEKAARDNGLKPLERPLGYVREGGNYEEWDTETLKPVQNGEKVVKSPRASGTPESLLVEETNDREFMAASTEMLAEYRKKMEEKIRIIDEKLNSGDNLD